MKYAEKASEYVIAHARYYERGVPPHGKLYGVTYKGQSITADDIGELVVKLQGVMEQEVQLDRELVAVGFIDRNGKAVVTKSSKCFESCTCKPTCKELIDGI